MRVALVGDRPPPFGGIAVHVEALAQALARQGHAVEVVDTAHAPTPHRLAARLGWLAARGFVLHLHTSGHNPKSWALVAACGRARAPLRRNGVTLHSGLLPGYLAGAPGRQWWARRALAPFGRVVAVSAGVRGALAAAGVQASRLVELPAFFPEAVRPGALGPEAAAVRAGFSELLCAAVAPSPVYGARVLGAALSLLRRSRPGLGGALFGPGSAQVLRELEALGLADGMIALGELPHAQALALVQASEVFVRPTLTDGDALSVREALSLGVRTVASDAAPRPPGVRLFRAGDPFALAEALDAALGAPRPMPASGDALPALVQMYRELSGRRISA
jgi:glycosyltransferase involved in cell wall biosynthesis